MNPIDEILIVEDFLSLEECSILLKEAIAAEEDKWIKHGEYDNIKILKSRNHKLLIDIKKRLSLFFEQNFQIQLVQAIHKTDSNTTWIAHSDDEGGKEIKYGVVIYLNDNFLGGELKYINIDYSIKPKQGVLVIHPGNSMYKHEVTKVLKGERYALTTFVRDMSIINNANN